MANNIIKRVWNQNRMVNIEDLCGMAFQAEAGGHTFQIFGVDDTGAAVPLSGTVAGVFRRPDNADIALTGASTGGVASVTLTEDCYAVPGFFGLTIFVTSGGQKTAVYAAVGTVAVTSGGVVAGETPQDVVDLINAIAAAVATIPASYTDLMTAIAPIYSTTALYSVGSYVWHDGHLYRCTTPITTAETWTAAHWTAAVLGDDVGELKSALSNNAFNVNSFENGAISETNGTNVNSSERIRTKSYISRTIKTLRSTDANIRFMLYGYTQGTGVYVGALQSDGSFGTTAGSHVTIDMGKIYKQHPVWNYKVVIRMSGGSVQIDTVNNIYFDTYISDISDIDELDTKVFFLDSATKRNSFSTALWENGSISDVNGGNVDNSERIRTKGYIPETVKSVRSNNANGRFALLAYTSGGAYVGEWNQSGVFGIGTGSFFPSLDMEAFWANPLFEGYQYRLIYRIAGGSVQIDTVTGVYLDTDATFNEKIKVIQYNIGKFNMGNSGGLSHDVETKILNYKKFFAQTDADFITMQEFTDTIDSEGVYATDATLFDPICLYKSYTEKETAIRGQRPLNSTAFSYLHTTGDNPSWCIYGNTIVGNKTIAIVSGVLNVSAPSGIDHSEQQIRALTKLTEQLLASYDYAIVGMDTNCLSKTEADTVRAYMEGKGYRSGNWSYLGYLDTYNLSSQMYHAIDNVFVKGNMRIVNFSVPDVYAELSSDHFPVIAEIRI